MQIYISILEHGSVSCGYKNTWQRAWAVRQVQSFHSKHICVCWASVALGRQRALACRASDYWALGESALTAAGLQSTARLQGGGHLGGKRPAGILPSLSQHCLCEVQVLFPLGDWLQKESRRQCNSKADLGQFLCLWLSYCLLVSGVYHLEGSSSDGSVWVLILTLADTSVLLCWVVLSQHQCWGNPRELFLVIYWQNCNLGLAPVMSF